MGAGRGLNLSCLTEKKECGVLSQLHGALPGAEFMGRVCQPPPQFDFLIHPMYRSHSDSSGFLLVGTAEHWACPWEDRSSGVSLSPAWSLSFIISSTYLCLTTF